MKKTRLCLSEIKKDVVISKIYLSLFLRLMSTTDIRLIMSITFNKYQNFLGMNC